MKVHQFGRADIEIIEHRAEMDGCTSLVPNAVRINGVEIAIPHGSKIRVHDLSDEEAVTVTLTLLASSVTIRTEPDTRPGT